MREERTRDQWFKQADQIRFVPAGSLPEECGIDTRVAVELEREPLFGEVALGSGKLHMQKRIREERFHEASRKRGDWHRDMEQKVFDLEATVTELQGQIKLLLSKFAKKS